MRKAHIPFAALGLAFLVPFGAAASEGHEAGVAALPQMDVALYPGVLFWLVVTFFLFFVVMKSVGVPAVLETQEKRKSAVDADLTAAREASDEAQKVMEVNEAALAAAREKAQKTVNDIILSAQEEATRQRDKQQQELTHRLSVAESNLVTARKKALEEAPAFLNALVMEIVAKAMQTGPAARAGE